MTKYEKGKIVKGTITGIENYGVFVALDEEYSGLIHISEISHGFVRNIDNLFDLGDNIDVQILDVDNDTYRLKLSVKNINSQKSVRVKKRKIQETSLGFKTLAYNLPIWIEKSVKNEQKAINSIDK